MLLGVVVGVLKSGALTVRGELLAALDGASGCCLPWQRLDKLSTRLACRACACVQTAPS